jgi:hypothetical protein
MPLICLRKKGCLLFLLIGESNLPLSECRGDGKPSTFWKTYHLDATEPHTPEKKKIRSTLRHLTEEVVLCRSCCEDSLINWNMNGSTQRVFGPVSSKQGKKVLTCCNAGA